MVLNTQRELTKVGLEMKRNQNHQTKDAKDRNKSMKEENLKKLKVEKVLSTYDISKNSFSTLFPTPFSLDPPHGVTRKEGVKKKEKKQEKEERKKLNPIKRGLDKLKELF